MSTPRERYRPAVRALAERIRTENGGLAAHLVMRAYEHAAAHHDGTFRLNGDPYLAHAVAVAHIVAEISIDSVVLAAALLHDVDGSPDDRRPVRGTFGHDVADLIDAATDLRRRHYPTADLDAVDERVLLLKLADRLHNLCTVDGLHRSKQLRKARHTLEVVVPLAERAGIPLDARLREAASDTISPGSSRRPRHRSVGAGLVTAAARLLPAAERERWASEWRGELAVLPSAAERLRFAADVALGAPSLAVVTRRSRP